MVDVYRLLPEGTPVQVINNRFYISPTPTLTRFDIVDAIVEKLKQIAAERRTGRVYFAPVDVFLGDRNALQPDIFYISNENSDIIHEDGIYGSPDIIIEVLSAGNKSNDLRKKKSVYEEFGVREYFIVDPADKSVVAYFLEDKQYHLQPTQTGKLISQVLHSEIVF